MDPLKSSLESPFVPTLSHATDRRTLKTDAVNFYISVVLLQTQPDGTKTLFEYWSRALTVAEQRHGAAQLEYVAFI